MELPVDQRTLRSRSMRLAKGGRGRRSGGQRYQTKIAQSTEVLKEAGTAIGANRAPPTSSSQSSAGTAFTRGCNGHGDKPCHKSQGWQCGSSHPAEWPCSSTRSFKIPLVFWESVVGGIRLSRNPFPFVACSLTQAALSIHCLPPRLPLSHQRHSLQIELHSLTTELLSLHHGEQRRQAHGSSLLFSCLMYDTRGPAILHAGLCCTKFRLG